MSPSETDSALPESFSPPLEVVRLPRPADRPTGRRFGSLVHEVLASSTTEAPPEELAQMHGRLLDASADEVAAAAEAVRVWHGHALAERARQAERCHHEWPVLAETDDGQLIDGSVDLAFRENGRWFVIDFKTDDQLDRAADEYRLQLGWYCWAVHRATGQPTHGIIVAL